MKKASIGWGSGSWPWPMRVGARPDVTQQGREICERLAAEVGETVNIAVLRSHYAVNVDQARGPSAVGTHNWVGELTPLHATSSGKVLLAFMPTDARRELLEAAGLHGSDGAHRHLDRGPGTRVDLRCAGWLRRVRRGTGARTQRRCRSDS